MQFKSNQKLLEENFREACQDKDFVKLVKYLKIDKNYASRLTSKLEQTVLELHNCHKCSGLNQCHNSYLGHVFTPKKNLDKVYFTYEACEYTKLKWEKKHDKDVAISFNERARMKDIETDDKKRLEVIRWLVKFIDDYDYNKKLQGLYLYGNFGCGKTFLIQAMFNELKDLKQVDGQLVYFPELLRSLKEDWDVYEKKMKYYEEVDLLCIDDIGSEKVNEWSRDEVLGTILQARMNNCRPTFFTSNLSLEQLEKHLMGSTKDFDTTVKARRIIERIKYLSYVIEMVSENKRSEAK